MFTKIATSLLFLFLSLMTATATFGALLDVDALHQLLGPTAWGWIALISACAAGVLMHGYLTADLDIMFPVALLGGGLVLLLVWAVLVICSPAALVFGFFAFLSGNLTCSLISPPIYLCISTFFVLSAQFLLFKILE